jgi:hypothetical protein
MTKSAPAAKRFDDMFAIADTAVKNQRKRATNRIADFDKRVNCHRRGIKLAATMVRHINGISPDCLYA